MQSRIKKHKGNPGGDQAYWQEVLTEIADRAQANRNFEANYNNPADLGSLLALETVTKHIVPHLDTNDMVSAKKVSRGWRHLFSSDEALRTHWMLQFKKNFSIDSALTQQALDSTILTGHQIRQLYKNFTGLQNAYHSKMPNYIKIMLRDLENLESVLFCAAGNHTALLNSIEKDVYPMWFEVACYTNNTDLACLLYRNLVSTGEDIHPNYRHYLGIADRFSSTALTSELLKITYEMTDNQYLTSDEEDKQIEAYTPVEHCHPRFTRNIIAALRNSKLEYSQALVEASIEAGNFDLTQFIVNQANHRFDLNLSVINKAALSGNVSLLNSLLDAAAPLNIQPDRSTLRAAAESGSIECTILVSGRYNLAFMNDTLEAALSSGHIGLVNHIIQIRPLIDMRLQRAESHEAASHSGNKSLTEYYMPCYSLILDALSLDEDGQALPEFIHHTLGMAYQTAPTFFKQIIANILDQRENYHLSAEEVQTIKNSPAYVDAFGGIAEELEEEQNPNLQLG